MIASTFSEEMPFIIGDLLFSSKEGKPDFMSPTQLSSIPRTAVAYDPEYMPHELWQKIYILRDNLAVALAGDYYEMKTFLQELKLRLTIYETLSKDSIERFLQDFDLSKNFSHSVMLMLLVTPHDDVSYVNRFFYGRWARLKNEHFGSIWASGSGAESFLRQFDAPVTFTTASPRETVDYAIAANLGLLAKWLAIEKGSGITLRDHWGSGFEMIFFNGQQFAKFQEIAFVIFEGRSDENGVTEAVFPAVVIFMRYENEILFITSLNLSGGSWSIAGDHVSYFSAKVEATLFVVPPLDLPMETAIQTKEDLSFETSVIAAGYSVLNHGQGLFNPSYFLRDAEINVKFVHDSGVEINVPCDFNQQILNGAKAAFEFERNNSHSDKLM